MPASQVELLGQSESAVHSTQVSVDVSQAGVGAAQSELARHATHTPVITLHTGVGFAQSALVLQAGAHTPTVPSCLLQAMPAPQLSTPPIK